MTTTQQPSTKQDILYLLLRQGPVTAQAIADHLSLTPQAIRRHLKDLEAEGLILHQAVQTGMGRPNYVYTLSHAGREQFPDRYDDFAVSLLDTLAETVGRDQMGNILRKQWERKALDYRTQLGKGTVEERVMRLVDLRREEGYMAEYYPVALDGSPLPEPTIAAPAFWLTEYNCAIAQIAESFPTVCGHELEMFATALQDCTVERTHWLVNGEHRCGYLIKPKTSG